MSVTQSRSSPDDLILALEEGHQRTADLVADLSHEQMLGPRLSIVNPLLWEIGHAAWFQEFWVLRHFHQQTPILSHGDALYNSAAVAHDTRWDLPLPTKAETLKYRRDVLDRVIQLRGRDEVARPSAEGNDETYFLRLALLHEYMHDEAFTYTRQTLGYSAPQFTAARPAASEAAHPGNASREASIAPHRAADPLAIGLGDAQIPGGTFMLGSFPVGAESRRLSEKRKSALPALHAPFVFDNEQWAHPVEVKPFAMARTAVSNREFAAFVEDGGYRRRELWSADGWRWREQATAAHPIYWEPQSGGRWLRRNFDQWVPLEENLPVLHVNWYEADAYSRWAGRRLPTEAEWELAAAAEPSADGRGISAHKRRFPWSDDPPTPDRANLDWRAMGCVPVDALPAGDSAFGCRQMIGNVWEWTATDFGPYPGFAPGPYKEYSAPWFGDHKVLRGGCWATRSGLISNVYRNFYKPDRRDVWAGFRTCAVS